MSDPRGQFEPVHLYEKSFWSERQLAAFRIACGLACVPDSRASAESWQRDRGAARRAWKRMTKGERRRMIDAYLERKKEREGATPRRAVDGRIALEGQD